MLPPPMKTGNLSVAAVMVAALAVAAAPAPAQTSAYYGICGIGQVPNPANPYYCITEGNGTARKRPKLTLKVRPRKDKAAPIRFRATGRLTSLKGVSKRAGC